jgi:hypothetical protein
VQKIFLLTLKKKAALHQEGLQREKRGEELLASKKLGTSITQSYGNEFC